MDVKTFAKYFDHALLKAQATQSEFEAYCQEGIKYEVKMLAVNPAAVQFCKRQVKGTPVLVGAAIGFPLGQMTVESKLFETRDAIEKGSDEIDYVINISALKSGQHGLVSEEMKCLVALCREKNTPIKVIFENCYLTEDEKKRLCEMANEIKPDYIKTSTGFGTSGATLADVKLMRKYADAAIKIKASGGIKTYEDVKQLIAAGVERIGTSNTATIIQDYKKERGET